MAGYLSGEGLGRRLEHLVEDRRQGQWHELRVDVRRREKRARWRTRAAERGHPFVCRECGRSFPGNMKNAFRNHIRECRGGDDIEEEL